MPSAKYRFHRDMESVSGMMSRSRPNTDAYTALQVWRGQHPERSYEVHGGDDDDNQPLEATLTWGDGDTRAGSDLEAACRANGVERRHAGQ